jgi:hypothetical protein
MPDAVLDDVGLPRRQQLRAGGRVFQPGKDHRLATLLTGRGLGSATAAQHGRREPARRVHPRAQSGTKPDRMVKSGPAPAVLVYDGQRLLVEIPARQ